MNRPPPIEHISKMLQSNMINVYTQNSQFTAVDSWILLKIFPNKIEEKHTPRCFSLTPKFFKRFNPTEKKSFVLQIDRRIMFIAQGHIELYRNIKLKFILECLASEYFFVYFIWYLVEPSHFLYSEYSLPYVRIRYENNTSKRFYFDWKILRRRERIRHFCCESLQMNWLKFQ